MRRLVKATSDTCILKGNAAVVGKGADIAARAAG